MTNLAGLCQSPVTVSLSNAPEPVVPGGHFTLFFDVKSSSTLPDLVRESMQLPDKWRLLSQRKPERTPGQQSLRYFFVIGTPAECPSGDYLVSLAVKAGEMQINAPVTITVRQIRKIEVFVVSQPEFVKEGDTLRVTYLIRNSGNNNEKFVLTTERGIIDSGKDTLALEPNASMNAVVSQVIPFTDNNAWQGASSLTVFMTGAETPVYTVTSIPVFSSKVKKIDPYFRFPVEIGGGYLSYRYGNRQVATYQYTASGKGFLDQKSNHYLDFTVRGPNQFIFPAAGTYDQYSVDYQFKKRLFISAGDYVLQLNNLMEFGRFGRGLRVEQQFVRGAYTAFYQHARFFPNQKDSFGGKFTYKVRESVQIGLHYASKNVVFHNRPFWSNLVGASGSVRTRDFSLETELTAGQANRKKDYAAFLRMQVARKWINFTTNVIYGGKHFYGFYNNSLLITNNLGFNITRKLTIGASSNFSDVNPSLDATLYSISPKDRSYTSFISYQPDKRNRFFVFYATAERQDRQQPAEYHYSEEFGNLSYNHHSEKFAILYQGRYGFSRNYLAADNAGRKESFSNLVQPSVRLFPWIWVGGYFEHQHTSKFSSRNVVENLFFYGGNTRINFKRNLYASLLYRNNYAPDELYVRRSFLDASLVLDLQRHVFSASGGRSYVPNISNRDQNTLFFNIRYALRLNIPLSKKRNIGSLKGRLTGSGYPKQGNLIQLGSHKFMTDSTGTFSFEGVAPDRYYLSITQNDSRGDGVVPGLRMPMLVEVKRDSIQVIEIPLTRTGSITGKAEFVKANQNGVAAALSEKPAVLVKLTNGESSFLTELNDKGEFSFKEMKPGTWDVSAFIPGNQDRFVIEDGNRQLALEADKTIDLVFRIRPNEKRIHFSERNFEVSVKK